MLKDTALRKKMSELGLSTVGSRQMLEKRHQEWVTLWNANCDSKNPKRRSELLHDLEVWERTMGSRAPTMSRALNTGAQIKDKDFDGAAWAARHDNSFKDLIARARSSRGKVNQKTQEGSKTEEPGTAQNDGKRVNDTIPVPAPSAVDVVDLTIPPSSQPEPPDSPSTRARGDVDMLEGSGTFFGNELLYPQGDGIPASIQPREPEGAPS
jgi:E3 ubiquitin-protein ligase RAD18